MKLIKMLGNFFKIGQKFCIEKNQKNAGKVVYNLSNNIFTSPRKLPWNAWVMYKFVDIFKILYIFI